VGELHQRIQELRGPIRPLSLNLNLTTSHRSGDLVLRTKELVIGYPGLNAEKERDGEQQPVGVELEAK
jgi:hypothetical protein